MVPVLVGLLTAATLAASYALWMLLVRPDAILGLLGRGAATEAEFFDEDPATLSLLRGAGAATVGLLAFLTGLVTAFLGATA